jgi:UDP-N-acetylmuramate dehydrogenase
MLSKQFAFTAEQSGGFPDRGLLARLPKVRGKLVANEPLADQTWFRVGGPAEILFRPADDDDLGVFLAGCPADIPITILGVASNTLIRDGGIPGVVIKLGPAFARIKTEGATITAGAACIDLNVARAAEAANIAGLEFLAGIPGTIGGGLRMNAGAYGSEFKNIIVSADGYDRQGKRHTLTNTDMGFSYRHSEAPTNMIFVSAMMQGQAGDADAIHTKMQEIQKSRADTQPIREKTGGSTFANPDGRKAWQLIEGAGCRGLTNGQAEMSDKHCNFLINTGNATAAEIEALGEEVRRRVQDKFGVELRWEIRRIGVTLDERGQL